MNVIRSVLVFLVLAICTYEPCAAQPKDTLFLKKGQVLIGELKGMVLGKIDFDDDDIDVVSIKSNKIKPLLQQHTNTSLKRSINKSFIPYLNPEVPETY